MKNRKEIVLFWGTLGVTLTLLVAALPAGVWARPDPFILPHQGWGRPFPSPYNRLPRWENPEIKDFPGIKPSSQDDRGQPCRQRQSCVVTAVVHNAQSSAAVAVPVGFSVWPFGIPGSTFVPFGYEVISVPPLQYTQAHAVWNPWVAGHSCYMVQLFTGPWNDKNMFNNVGQKNEWIAPAPLIIVPIKIAGPLEKLAVIEFKVEAQKGEAELVMITGPERSRLAEEMAEFVKKMEVLKAKKDFEAMADHFKAAVDQKLGTEVLEEEFGRFEEMREKLTAMAAAKAGKRLEWVKVDRMMQLWGGVIGKLEPGGWIRITAVIDDKIWGGVTIYFPAE